jgi:hypothetical protein
MKTPTLEEKVEQYEQFLHNINMMLVASNTEGIQRLIDNADRWSYMHRVSNGELSEEEQQKLIDKAFWNLNKFYTSHETEKLRLDKRLAGREKPNLDEVEFGTPHLKEE